MPSYDGLERWREPISLALLTLVFASLQWGTLRGLLARGPAAIDTPADGSLLVMLAITAFGAVYETRQRIAD